MPIPVQVAPVGAIASGATLQVASSFAAKPTRGNTIIVGAAVYGTPGTLSVTDSYGNSYIRDELKNGTSNGAVQAAIFRCSGVNVISGTFTVTLTTTGTNVGGMTIFAVEYWGLAASPVDATASNAGSAVRDCGTLITTNANDLLVGVFANDTASSNQGGGPGAGYAMEAVEQNGSSFMAGIFEDRIVTSPGSYDVPVTAGAASDCAGVAVAYRFAFTGLLPFIPDASAIIIRYQDYIY